MRLMLENDGEGAPVSALPATRTVARAMGGYDPACPDPNEAGALRR